MRGFRERFEAYGGDYRETMERFMGNEALYLRLLDLFFQDENLQKLGTALDAGDLPGAFAAAHTLKGVVGNLGLEPLYRAVCDMVEPLRAGAGRDYAAMYRDVQARFQEVAALREALRAGA